MVFQKRKRKRKIHEEIEFHNSVQFKIEFLLPFIGCRKVLGKMSKKPRKYTGT